ncbi:CAP domain-containing protein [Nocardioides sp. CER19]|uniref:CAP domain-containing protein n=1 Tax=Nocardioides sp. CER19 TaxID=3038538 RepID=UPI0024478797|nr:CAP domain-containing protein [Nocardioides sp. CER19]MDH2413961.1 CAP domain-containing protein [Nocardioides sp. CER19]
MSSITRAVLLPVVAALTLGVAALIGPSAQAATPHSYGAAAVKATNAARRAHDLRRLRANACLQGFADRQAARMAAQRRMFHQDIRVPLRRCGMHTVGENVAVGYATGRGVVRNGWMRSPGHRANILRRSFHLVAVAARKGADGRWYASQVFGAR